MNKVLGITLSTSVVRRRGRAAPACAPPSSGRAPAIARAAACGRCRCARRSGRSGRPPRSREPMMKRLGGELVEVGADAVGRHEARGAAPARIGLVLEGQRLAHLVERVAGAAADMALADDRELRRPAAGRPPRGCRGTARSSLPTFSSLTIGEGIQASASLAARLTATSTSPAIQIGGPPGCLGLMLDCTLLSVWKRPLCSTTSSRHSLRITSTPSTKRGTRSLKGTPIESNSSWR